MPALTYVLGAPGVGKTAMLEHLRRGMPSWTVLDWDWLMPAARALTGRTISEHRDLWRPYAELVRHVLVALGQQPVLLMTVCTPDELAGGPDGWPQGDWLLLDCDDEERAHRLQARGDAEASIAEALEDAAAYRSLGLPCVRTDDPAIQDVASRVMHWVTSR